MTELRAGEPVRVAGRTVPVIRLLAPNAGPMTGPGTNTYLIGERELALVDPGPAEQAHIEAILTAIGDRPLRWILVTHTHADHSPAALPLDEGEMDALYDLPFARRPHFSYGAARIPAFDTVKDSVVTMRGCFGGCTFCSITEHEGRIIQSRSEQSVLREVRQLSRMEGFSGVLTDLGGPTANMYKLRCKDERIEQACRRLSCVHPKVCENLITDHDPLVKLMRKVRTEPGIKKVFIASGVRYDLAEKSPSFIRELAEHHTGGQLSVAPEHTNEDVLRHMKKPAIQSYERFARAFCQASEKAGKEQYLVPYFIVGHPGSTFADTIELALWLKQNGMRPRQVQEFIPTPMAIATTMYFTGIDPLTGETVPVVRDLRDKKRLKALLYWWDEDKWPLAREALIAAGRRDLIGRRPGCLVPPRSQPKPGRSRVRPVGPRR